MIGKHIAVLGPTGSGKTTLARAIGHARGLPVIELDSLFHGPNWTPASAYQFRAEVAQQLFAHPAGWVTDGNYSQVRDLILVRADTVIWLQLPFFTVHWRVWRRTLRRLVTRERLWNNNRESWRKTFLSKDSLLLWSITSWKPHRHAISAVANDFGIKGQVVILRSPRQVTAFLAGLSAGAVGSSGGQHA
jgi:adenylate kinase family enzyme